MKHCFSLSKKSKVFLRFFKSKSDLEKIYATPKPKSKFYLEISRNTPPLCHSAKCRVVLSIIVDFSRWPIDSTPASVSGTETMSPPLDIQDTLLRRLERGLASQRRRPPPRVCREDTPRTEERQDNLSWTRYKAAQAPIYPKREKTQANP